MEVFISLCNASVTATNDIQELAKQIIPLIQKEMQNQDNLKPLKGIKGIFELNVTQGGKLKGTWYVELTGDVSSPTIHEGKPSKKATISSTMSDDVMVKLAGGKLQPMAAFMSGKIKLSGNIMLAQRLQVAFGQGSIAQRGRLIAMEIIEKNEYLKAKL